MGITLSRCSWKCPSNNYTRNRRPRPSSYGADQTGRQPGDASPKTALGRYGVREKRLSTLFILASSKDVCITDPLNCFASIRKKFNSGTKHDTGGPLRKQLELYSRTRLKRHRLMRHLVYNVRYSVISINSSLSTTILYTSVIKTLAYNDTKYPVPFITL